MEFSSFSGVWKRTMIYEPIGQIGPEDDNAMDVIWIQSSSGLFIDIRVPPNHTGSLTLKKCKSFAGHISYSVENQHLTWHREMDYRPSMGADIGAITFLNDTTIQEDSVLPGDDYREIWNNITDKTNGLNVKPLDFAAQIESKLDSLVKNKGFFIINNNTFGLTLTRHSENVEGEAQVDDNVLHQYFNGEIENNVALDTYVARYVSIIGRIVSNEETNCIEYIVDYSINPEYITKSLFRDVCLMDIFNPMEYNWDVRCGEAPVEIGIM